MKKVRFLVLALAVAMMLMGAGYAAWTDKLSIEEMVIESGTLDVDFVPMSDDNQVELEMSQYVQGLAAIVDFQGIEPEFAVPEVDGKNKDKVVVAFANLYPGAEATAVMKIKNVGTLPVKLDKVALYKQPGSNPILLDYMNVSGSAFGQSFAFTDESGVFTAAELGLDSYEIPAGAEEIITITLAMDTDAPNEVTESTSVRYVAQPYFKQFNM